jgi:exopolysaccharide biosynthesis polyprenyl glycosylphosphotransferase
VGAGELTAGSAAAADVAALATPRIRRRRRELARAVVPLLLVHDVVAVLASYALAFAVRSLLPVPLTSDYLPSEVAWQPHDALVILLATQLPLLYVFGLHDVRLLRERAPRGAAVLAAVAAQVLAVSAWYFFRSEIVFPRSVLLLYAVADASLLLGSRALARAAVSGRAAVVRAALVGAPADVADLHRQLASGQSRHGVEVVGAVRAPGASGAAPLDATPPWLGATRDLARLAREHRLDQLIVVPGASDKEALLDAVLRACTGVAGLRVAVVPSVYELRVGRLASLHIDDVPLIEVVRDPADAASFRVKAVLDHVLALVLLVLALPVLLLAALVLRATSPGPVLFLQRRIGRDGREFVIYKLRTMHDDAERATGPVLAVDGDERVTAAGRFLRATRIDEIPQLLNVLNGTMSLVGPRPERPEFAEALLRDVPGYGERWLVKPGLSGLAQVRGEYHTSPEYKLKYDLAYIHNHTVLLDLRILAETVKTLFARRGV